MNLKPARMALLSLSVALAVAACNKPADQTNVATAPADGANAAATAAQDPSAAKVSGAGSSFVYPLVSKWSADYAGTTGNQVNYQSIGSGGGIAQIKAGTVDFGASDKPLPSDELSQAGLGQFPAAIGGVVPVVNIEGIEAGKLRLTGELLANIFLGKVTMWNDPAIAAANPGVKLPDAKISLVHRSDGSGTTFNFTNYLSKVNADWKAKVGEGTSVQWPGGVGGKGNEGVASYVKQIKNSIGYVELAYALQSAMPYTSMQNAAGQWIEPNAESFAAAAESADWANAKDFNLVITNAPGEKAWPITATTFMLMHKQPSDAKRSAQTLAFFKWAFESGQKQAEELHYVPLPAPLVTQIEAYWAAASSPRKREVLFNSRITGHPAPLLLLLAVASPRKSENSVLSDSALQTTEQNQSPWIPAFAGMTDIEHRLPSEPPAATSHLHASCIPVVLTRAHRTA